MSKSTDQNESCFFCHSCGGTGLIRDIAGKRKIICRSCNAEIRFSKSGEIESAKVSGHDHSQVADVTKRIMEETRSKENRPHQASKVRIGIITALEKEYTSVKVGLQNTKTENFIGKGADRRYCVGEIDGPNGTHTVALALAAAGNNSAAIRASSMLSHFPALEDIIMVGIAGGVPSPMKAEDHVRLGDIVVSSKKGVVQYDLVKQTGASKEIRSCPMPPSAHLIEGVRLLVAEELAGDRPWDIISQGILHRLGQCRPSDSLDVLHSSDSTAEVINHPSDPRRLPNVPRVFLGTIGAANTLLKDPTLRDALDKQFGIRAIEMESSGIADATWTRGVGYLAVRGICDYCDSYKNDDWQTYAAAVAAAYAIALIASLPVA